MPHLKTGRRESVSWVRIPPHPPRLKLFILQCFMDFRWCEIRDSLRGFRAYVHRLHGPVRPMSPVCGGPIPRISLSAVRVVRFAAPRRRASRPVTRSPSAFWGRRGHCQTNLSRRARLTQHMARTALGYTIIFVGHDGRMFGGVRGLPVSLRGLFQDQLV